MRAITWTAVALTTVILAYIIRKPALNWAFNHHTDQDRNTRRMDTQNAYLDQRDRTVTATACARCGRPATYPDSGIITCVCGNRIHGAHT